MLPEVGPLSPEVCAQCVSNHGLCDRHHAGVLPLLARNVGWLKLMGEALVEQKRRQSKRRKDAPVSAEQTAHLERKQAARTASASRAARGVNMRTARARSLARLAA